MSSFGVLQGNPEDWQQGANETAVALGELRGQLLSMQKHREGLLESIRSRHTAPAVAGSFDKLQSTGKSLEARLEHIQESLKASGYSVDESDLHGAARVAAHEGLDTNWEKDSLPTALDPMVSGKIDLGSL